MSSQIDEPDYGDLLEDMFFDDGSTLPAGRFILPRVEVELAFVLRKRLGGPGCTLNDVLAATDYATPAIEIIDARIQQIDPATGIAAAIFTQLLPFFDARMVETLLQFEEGVYARLGAATPA